MDIERQAFIKAITENPQDDTPRLMYSDWLKERGDPLGDFIEAQIRLHEVGDCNWFRKTAPNDPCSWVWNRSDPLTGELYDYCSAYVENHEEDWLSILPNKIKIKGWSRGFPAHLAVDFRVWLDRSEDILAATPVLKVQMTGKQVKPERKWDTAQFQWRGRIADEYRYAPRPWIRSPVFSFVVGSNTEYCAFSCNERRWLLEKYWSGVIFIV